MRDVSLKAVSSKSGRMDLAFQMPVGKWKGRPYLHRVVGWEFYRPAGMTWLTFKNREVDHLTVDPRVVVRGGVEVVTPEENSTRFWAAPRFGVRKRPASVGAAMGRHRRR